MIRTIFLVSNLLISGCVATTATTPLPTTFSLPSDLEIHETQFVSRFLQACIDPRKSTSNAGWTEASDNRLKEMGLGQLKRKVLEIPGGGAPVSEKQDVFVAEDGTGLVLEYVVISSRGKSDEHRCSVYADREFLPSCTALGQALKRPPDRNTRYENTGAHFINWQATQENRDISIECATSPQSVTLPYEGTQLTVKSRTRAVLGKPRNIQHDRKAADRSHR